MDARGMPFVASILNKSGGSLNSDESTAFICYHGNRHIVLQAYIKFTWL
jgi:hypothetical protein